MESLLVSSTSSGDPETKEYRDYDANYAYRPLEDALGLKPAKLDEKTPAYIIQRASFWKYVGIVILSVAGLFALYVGTKGTMYDIKKNLIDHLRMERRTEHDLAARLASMQLELESEYVKRNREAVIAAEFRENIRHAELEQNRNITAGLKSIALSSSLSREQYKAVLHLFHNSLSQFHNDAQVVAHSLTSKFEVRATAARDMLSKLKQDLHETFATEIKARNKYKESEAHEKGDVAGDGYFDDDPVKSAERFSSPKDHAAYMEHMRSEEEMKRRLTRFFLEFQAFESDFKPIDINPRESLFRNLASLFDRVRKATYLTDDEKYYETMDQLTTELSQYNKELARRNIPAYNPSQISLFLYLRNVLMDASFDQISGKVRSWRDRWAKDPYSTFDLLQEIEQDIYDGLIPEEFLYEDLISYDLGEGKALGSYTKDVDADAFMKSELKRLGLLAEEERRRAVKSAPVSLSTVSPPAPASLLSSSSVAVTAAPAETKAEGGAVSRQFTAEMTAAGAAASP